MYLLYCIVGTKLVKLHCQDSITFCPFFLALLLCAFVSFNSDECGEPPICLWGTNAVPALRVTLCVHCIAVVSHVTTSQPPLSMWQFSAFCAWMCLHAVSAYSCSSSYMVVLSIESQECWFSTQGKVCDVCHWSSIHQLHCRSCRH